MTLMNKLFDFSDYYCVEKIMNKNNITPTCTTSTLKPFNMEDALIRTFVRIIVGLYHNLE